MGWYFPLLAIGLSCGVALGTINAQRARIPFPTIRSFVLISLLGGLLGARLFHIFFEGWLTYYSLRPLEIFQPWLGGFSVLGGLLSVLVLVVVVFRKQRQALYPLLDSFTPAFLLGLGIARVGCFLNGCCYGLPTDRFWGVSASASRKVLQSQIDMGFLPFDARVPLPVHPTQLYESALCLVACGLTQYLLMRGRWRRGKVFLLGVASYAIIRFFIEFVRADQRGVFLDGFLSIPQAVSLGLIGLVGGVGCLWRNRPENSSESRKEPTRPPEDLS